MIKKKITNQSSFYQFISRLENIVETIVCKYSRGKGGRMILKRERNLEKNFDRQGSRKILIQFLSRKLGKLAVVVVVVVIESRDTVCRFDASSIPGKFYSLAPLPLSYAPLGARKVS